MKKTLAKNILVMIIIFLFPFNAFAAASDPIMIDGYFEDWEGKEHTQFYPGNKPKPKKVVSEVGVVREEDNIYFHVIFSRDTSQMFAMYLMDIELYLDPDDASPWRVCYARPNFVNPFFSNILNDEQSEELFAGEGDTSPKDPKDDTAVQPSEIDTTAPENPQDNGAEPQSPQGNEAGTQTPLEDSEGTKNPPEDTGGTQTPSEPGTGDEQGGTPPTEEPAGPAEETPPAEQPTEENPPTEEPSDGNPPVEEPTEEIPPAEEPTEELPTLPEQLEQLEEEGLLDFENPFFNDIEEFTVYRGNKAVGSGYLYYDFWSPGVGNAAPDEAEFYIDLTRLTNETNNIMDITVKIPFLGWQSVSCVGVSTSPYILSTIGAAIAIVSAATYSYKRRLPAKLIKED